MLPNLKYFDLKLTEIENPPKKDRDKWLVQISHTEYTVEEIEQGSWLTRLKNALE